jgi:uncharacterized membrane protein
MQRYPTRRSSSAPLIVVTVGIGALLAYAMSSPRRRAALVAAGQSALDAGSRMATLSAERLHDVIPDAMQDSMSRLAETARSASESIGSTAAARLQDAVDRATELMHEVVARARKVPDEARVGTERLADAAESASEDAVEESSGRSSARGVMIAAAAIGAGIYAMQRYGTSERIRQKVGADENGTIRLEKTLLIDAPIEQVFDTWANYENFPRFMSNVKSVQPLGGDRSHWKVCGPAGIGVEFDSVARQQRPSELSWESEPDSSVRNEGRVTLVPEGAGTRATVRMSYRPPAGALGQAVSSLFGANPQQEFDEDLRRMKQFIEGRQVSTASSL